MDNNAVVLADVIKRIVLLEQGLSATNLGVAELRKDASANDDCLDAALRAELNTMMDKLGAELRAADKAVLEKFDVLQGITQGAVSATRTLDLKIDLGQHPSTCDSRSSGPAARD